MTRATNIAAGRTGLVLAIALCWIGAAKDAAAQLDPLLFLKGTQPNVLLVVDTANRMQRGADGVYRDAFVYTKTGQLHETTLGITSGNTGTRYRRKYINLVHTDPSTSGGDRFNADRITIVGDLMSEFTHFDWYTRLGLARASLTAALTLNQRVARFGLLKTRQSNPKLGSQGNEGPVKVTDPLQSTPTDHGGTSKWLITRPTVDAVNGSLSSTTAPVVQAGSSNANDNILAILNRAVGSANGCGTGSSCALTPGGRDSKNDVDAPIDTMLDDAKAEAERLINADTACRNTVVVLVVGGGRGTTSSGDVGAKAGQFLSLGSVTPKRRVPIYVIAIAPPAVDVASLQSIAANSGGKYTEITPAMVAAATPGQAVPEFVRAVNEAVQHTFTTTTEFNAPPTATDPIGPKSEYQSTSPLIGTVNLEGAKDIDGKALVNDVITNPKTGTTIPQRSNLLVTTSFLMPGFEGRLRGFRVYEPEPDETRPTGWKFKSKGTRLWVASAPAAATRNIYTWVPNAGLVPFQPGNPEIEAAIGTSNPGEIINLVRSEPLGAFVSSTPAIMDPPSLDPPPDPAYPAFAEENKGRRTMIWIGGNNGMLHGIDARLGVEVWAFIPYNLLPKLKELKAGQPVGDFRYYVDSSPKVADVKVNGAWRTYLIVGQGAGGTFYQAFDVTLDGMSDVVSPTDNNVANVLAYFALPDALAAVKFAWAFPSYTQFDLNKKPWGDISSAAPEVSKTVGETWSDPAVGQAASNTGKFTVIVGSGFYKYSLQQENRNLVTGTHLYLLDVATGAVFDSRSVGSDGLGENVDDCATANNCSRQKNALQADPVATGPPDVRYITKTYIGDLDGRLWRFDIGESATGTPRFMAAPTKLFDAGASQPMFSSMATVNVGGTQQYVFQGTGSDMLPSNGVSTNYKLFVVLDNGTSGSKTAEISLEKTDSVGGDEKVTAFPAVAGDIVFFATSTFKPTDLCAQPDGNLYAFTFIGGPAYDTNNDGRITTGGAGDRTKVYTSASQRASAPFVVDQHLVVATGNKLQMFGDPEDHNNGISQVGVRILSWREVR